MKRRSHFLLLAGLFLCLTQIHAQVGIGTPMPDNSAQLDIVAQDKGILIPRVALSSTQDMGTISSGNVESLLVFNTASSNDIKPGYYYWFDNNWHRVVTADDVSNGGVIDNVVVYDPAGDVFNYINNSGDHVTIDLEALVKDSETITLLEENHDGTYTYTNESGDEVIIDANTTTVELIDGVYAFKDATGATITTIDTNANASSYDNTASELTATNVQAAIDEVVSTINSGSGVKLIDNTDGTVSLVAEDGTSLGTINKASVTDNGDGTYTIDNGDGTPVTIDTNADASSYDNTASELTATNVQSAIDEVVSTINSGGGVELIDNANGTVSLVAEDGTPLGTINKTSVTDNLDGTYTIDNGDGTPVTIDTNADASSYDNTASELTATNVQSAIDEVVSTINSGGGVELIDNANGTVSLVAEDGTPLGTINKAAVTDNGDGTYTIDNGDGTPVTIDTNADASSYDNTASELTATNVQSAIDEVVSTINSGGGVELIDNANGTVSLVAEDGTPLGTINKASVTDNLDGTYTIDNGDGTPVTIDTNADASSYDNTASELTATNVQSAIDEVVSTINSGGGVELIDNANGTVSLIAEDGTPLGTINKASVTDNGDGTYTIDNGDGTPVTIDTNADASSYDNTASELTATNVQAAIDEVVSTINSGGGVELIDNANGTVSLVAEDGTPLGTINKASVTDNLDGTYTIDNGDGTPVTIDTNADASSYDNTASELTATNVQSAIDEVVSTINSGGGVELIDNGDGTVSLVAEDGTSLGTIDKASVTDNLDGTYTIDNGDGTPVTIDTNADASSYDNTASELTATNVQSAIDEVVSTINSGGGVELIDNANGTVSLVAEDGTSLGTIDKAAVTDNLDGTYTIDNGDGTPVTIDTNADASSYDNTASELTATNVQSAIDEVVSTINSGSGVELIDNGDGTVSLVAEDGTSLGTIDKAAVTDNLDGTYTIDNGDGTPVTIDTNANASSYDNTVSELTATNVQSAIDEVVSTINSGGGVELIDNGDGTVSLVAEDGTSLGTIDKASVTDNGDGTYTIDNGDGTPVTIDTNANASSYDNTVSGLTSDNVQAAIDEVVAKVAVVENAKGDLKLAGGLEFTGTADGLDKLLADTNIQIADGGISTDKLADNAVTNLKLDNNSVTNDKLAVDAVESDNILDGAIGPLDLNANVAGDALSQDDDTMALNVNANNGLTISDDNVQLGGVLIEETAITTDVDNTLAIVGLQTGAAVDNLVVVDPVSGVLRQAKAAMPKFFYMPSIVFDVSTSGPSTKDLHQLYVEQYGTPIVSSAGASGAIPTLAATDLEYYITYYDDNLFSNVTIDANGVLSYTINASAVTAGSFMNIVFVVK